MTLDAMIKYCEAQNEIYAEVTEPGARTVMDCLIAALKAAQGMRDDLEYAGRYSFHAEAWDTATKEDV